MCWPFGFCGEAGVAGAGPLGAAGLGGRGCGGCCLGVGPCSSEISAHVNFDRLCSTSQM